MTKDRTLSFLGLMKKAGALEAGEYKTGNASREHRAVIIGACEDSAENAVHRAYNFSESNGIPFIRFNLLKSEVSAALGLSDCSLFCLTDAGFAAALLKMTDEENYSELIKELEKKVKKPSAAKKNKHRRTDI